VTISRLAFLIQRNRQRDLAVTCEIRRAAGIASEIHAWAVKRVNADRTRAVWRFRRRP